MNNFFNNQPIFSLIWKRKIHFIIIGIVSVLLSIIFSSPPFIPPKYKSTARLYPANIKTLSEESETEQMLEILNSRDIKLKMFTTFHLDKIYNIDKSSPHYISYILNEYNKNVKIQKTSFESVEISVLDTNPDRACEMCDSIIHFFNIKMREITKSKDLEMVNLSKDELSKKYSHLDSINHKLTRLRDKYGILDYNSQAEKVTEGYLNALSTNTCSPNNLDIIKNLYNNLSKKGIESKLLEARLDYLINSIDSLTTQYDLHLSEYEKKVTYTNIIEEPIPADKKTYPVRWIIVILSLITSLFFGLVIFLILDYRKNT